MHALRARPGFRADFLVEVLNATDYGQVISGSTRDKLTQDQLKTIPIPALDLDDQTLMIERLRRDRTHSAELIRTLSTQIGLLRERRQALITAAVTGELAV